MIAFEIVNSIDLFHNLIFLSFVKVPKKLKNGKKIYCFDLTLQNITKTIKWSQIAQREKEDTSKRNTSRSKNKMESQIQNGSNNGKRF